MVPSQLLNVCSVTHVLQGLNAPICSNTNTNSVKQLEKDFSQNPAKPSFKLRCKSGKLFMLPLIFIESGLTEISRINGSIYL